MLPPCTTGLELDLPGKPNEGLGDTIEQIFGTDEHVAAHFAVSGTHHGEFSEIQPTGKRIDFDQINLYRFEAGLRAAGPWTDDDPNMPGVN